MYLVSIHNGAFFSNIALSWIFKKQLCEREQDAIRMLSMPECHAEQEGDAFYCFRRRASTALPLYATSALEQEYEYCFVLFRQYKCEALRRGFFQVRVLSH